MKTANDFREMINTAEANGGSISEIKKGFEQWNSEPCDVIVDGREVFIDDVRLTDDEIVSFFNYARGIGQNRKDGKG